MLRKGRQKTDGYIVSWYRRKQWQRVISVLTCVVMFLTTYVMILPALTMEGKMSCGKDEHTHVEACYTDEELVCGFEEHVHELACMSDFSADVETQEQWEESMAAVELSGKPAKDLASIARTQVGYTESSANYLVEDDGVTVNGYTRYGDWNQTPYSEWNELFILFCLHYAGVSETEIPVPQENESWMETLNQASALKSGDYTPKSGDLVFLEISKSDEANEYVGIVESLDSQNQITVIIGDYDNEVSYETFDLADEAIKAYVDVPDGADEEELEIEGLTQTYKEVNLDADSTATTTDLSPYLDKITVYHKADVWGAVWEVLPENEPLPESELVRFAISYSIPGGTLGNGITGVHYQLPVTKVAEAKSGDVYNSEGVHVGTYNISTTGLVTITFFDYFVSENSIGRMISGLVNFDSSVGQLDEDNDNIIDLEFSDGESVYIEIQETIKDDLTVKKTATVVNEDTGTISYTVTVNSVSGTSEDVSITDWMTNVAYESGFSVVKTDASGNKTTVNVDTPSIGATSLDMTLPKMNAGDYYTITYIGKLKNAGNGSASANNGISISSKNEDGDNLDYSTSVEVKFDNVMLDKTGIINDNGKVNWTILVGQEGKSLNGWTLTDTLNGVALAETVTIKFADGQTINTTLPYTFGNVNGVVTVTYTTDLEYPLGQSGMKNVATLEPPEGTDYPEYSDDYRALEPGDNSWETYNPMTKEAKDVIASDDKSTATIGWTLKIDVEDGGIYPEIVTDASGNTENRGWYFQDSLQDGQYFTDAQWTALEAEVKTELMNLYQWDEAEASTGYKITKITNNSKTTGFKVTIYEALAKGSSFTIDYETTADLSDSNQTKNFRNSATINNKVWSGSTATYVPLVSKMDANGNTSDTVTSLMDMTDKTIGWKIQIYMPQAFQSEKITIIENLPDQVKLDSVSLTLPDKSTANFTFDSNGNGTATVGTYTLTAVLTNVDGDQKLTFTLPADFVTAYVKQKLVFNVNTKLPDDFSIPEGSTVVELNNSVVVNSGDENTYEDGDDHTQIITNEDTSKKVVKSAEAATNNVIKYSVVLNPNSTDLIPDSDVMTVEDNLEFWNYSETDVYGASLVPGSIKLYQIDYAGNILKDLTSEMTYTYNQTTEYPWGGAQHKITSTLVLTVPDSTRLRLDYNYKITGNVHSGVNLTNIATIRELKEDAKSTHYEWFYINESDAEANLHAVNVYKVDADNYAKLLEGAHYELYKYVVDETTGEGEWHFDHKVISNGESSLELKDLVENQAYYLIETTAPKGYILDQSRHYFLIYNPYSSYGNGELIKPDDFPASAYVASSGAVYIENQKASTEIVVEKKWQDYLGNELTNLPEDTSIKLQLKQLWNRYPKDFDSTKLGTDASVKLTFGEWSYEEGLYEQTHNLKVGDILTIKLETTDLHIHDGTSHNPGLMEITSTANNYLEMTKTDTGKKDSFGNTIYEYAFTYLVKSDAELHGWVYPENSHSYSITTSTTSYTDVTTSKEAVNYGNPVVVDGTTDWTYTYSDLPLYELSEIGHITGYYSYYVEEVEAPSGYSVSYSGMNTAETAGNSGTITITNKQKPIVSQIYVEKKWISSNTGGYTSAPPNVSEISFKLFQVYETTEGARSEIVYGPYSITADGNWMWDSANTAEFKEGVPVANIDSSGKLLGTYSYYVTEVTEGYAVSYSHGTADTALKTAGTITISNKHNWIDIDYELPHTGGSGTLIYTIIGMMLIAVVLVYNNRRCRRNE